MIEKSLRTAEVKAWLLYECGVRWAACKKWNLHSKLLESLSVALVLGSQGFIQLSTFTFLKLPHPADFSTERSSCDIYQVY